VMGVLAVVVRDGQVGVAYIVPSAYMHSDVVWE